jgi:hypothetical protein
LEAARVEETPEAVFPEAAEILAAEVPRVIGSITVLAVAHRMYTL